MTATVSTTIPTYRPPGFVTRRVMNPIVAFLTRRGISVWGSRILEVRGRRSGALRRVPVNVLTLDGVDYLVAPRGVTQWVRNLRAAGEASVRVGRRHTDVVAHELDDADKVPVLRAYLARWKAEVGAFFDGVDDTSTDDDLARIAPRHPVFRLTPTNGDVES
ncbi:MAG: nitroreductase family deazaflavin-dependent oxidoreductase [Acidimicrobiia bacterium]|nr:nitroreductase family deazaflavin-dependent oxidoreductase [Acidimicrobiia bacterium]